MVEIERSITGYGLHCSAVVTPLVTGVPIAGLVITGVATSTGSDARALSKRELIET